jgi:hypothetical protein
VHSTTNPNVLDLARFDQVANPALVYTNAIGKLPRRL